MLASSIGKMLQKYIYCLISAVKCHYNACHYMYSANASLMLYRYQSKYMRNILSKYIWSVYINKVFKRYTFSHDISLTHSYLKHPNTHLQIHFLKKIFVEWKYFHSTCNSTTVEFSLWDVFSHAVYAMVNHDFNPPKYFNRSMINDAFWGQTLSVLKLEYSRITRSIPWLLMPWDLASQAINSQWYWLRRINESLSFIGRFYKHLCHLTVAK